MTKLDLLRETLIQVRARYEQSCPEAVPIEPPWRITESQGSNLIVTSSASVNSNSFGG
ncbi:MAG: hypothetical protein HY319_31995 [Armatimonadetes bacterium]|nr:hypothetical protein [Armatimonadota bacterium]